MVTVLYWAGLVSGGLVVIDGLFFGFLSKDGKSVISIPFLLLAAAAVGKYLGY